MIPLDDRGLLLGDGLFETVLARDGALILMDRHAARMRAGAQALGLPPPEAGELIAAAQAALAETGLDQGQAAVRLTLTAGSGGRGLDRPGRMIPRLVATAAPTAKPAGGVVLAVAQVRRNAGSPASRLKTLAYLDNVLARRQAQAAGAEEAVMLNTDGHLACAAAANLFWVRGETLFTPALACGVLEGIMRGQVIAAAGATGLTVAEVAEGPGALDGADAVFVTNSLVGVRPAASVDGRAYAVGRAAQTLAGLTAAVSSW